MSITCCALDHPEDAIPLLRTLRAGLTTDQFRHRFAVSCKDGYRLIAAYGDTEIVGVLGYVINETLCWRRTFFIDDLVVDETHRSRGIGAALLNTAHEMARQEDCDHLRLCSGLDRTAAHRFYEAGGMTRFSYQFVTPLKET